MRTVGLLALAMVACQAPEGLKRHEEPDVGDPPEGVEEIPGEDTGAVDPGGPDPVSDALFDVTRVHEVRITLPADGESGLSVNPREYVEASIELGGERFDGIGVRLKGNNSFRPISEKPSFKLKLDAFSDQSFGRLTSITLNNMIEDPSFAREALSYWLWNDDGALAPRAAYAQVYVNDTYYGLYLLLESMDDAFLKRRFTDPSGDLWEGEGDADFTVAGVEFFTRKEGVGDRSRLDAIVSALATPTADYYSSAGQHFQMDQLIDYWAWTMATANMDGYPYTLNDFVIYADPAEGGRMTMSPWGMDESWNPEFTFQWGQGVALFNCAADRACLDRVKARTEQALQHFEDADVPGQLQAFYDLSAEPVATDPRATWTPLEVAESRAALLAFVEGWPATLRAQMYE